MGYSGAKRHNSIHVIEVHTTLKCTKITPGLNQSSLSSFGINLLNKTLTFKVHQTINLDEISNHKNEGTKDDMLNLHSNSFSSLANLKFAIQLCFTRLSIRLTRKTSVQWDIDYLCSC